MAVVMSLKARAMPKASRLLSTCMAMPASSPPVASTRKPATSPKANRSTKTGGSCAPCASANSRAGTTTARMREGTRVPTAWVR